MQEAVRKALEGASAGMGASADTGSLPARASDAAPEDGSSARSAHTNVSTAAWKRYLGYQEGTAASGVPATLRAVAAAPGNHLLQAFRMRCV